MLDRFSIALPPIEDLIADRLAQYEASLRRDTELLMQARLLHQLAEHVDQDYLLRRCRKEMADISLLQAEERTDANPAQP